MFTQRISAITKPIFHIERRPENDLVIQDKSVSRFHASIRVGNGRFVLSDRNSQNGIIVNKTKVNEIILKIGTLIYFGKAMVVFFQEDKRIADSLEMDTEELEDI